MKTGAELITEERQRQIVEEEWTAEHDDEHSLGEMAVAAACYAWPPPRPVDVKKAWPWDRRWWKPSPLPLGATAGEKLDGRIRELVKAGALIAAEIDRLSRTVKP